MQRCRRSPYSRRAAAALLVSKRWHRVFLSEPALWRQYAVAVYDPLQDWQLALLRRVGGAVTSLSVAADLSEEAQARMFGWLQPSQLQQLDVAGAVPQLGELLLPFSRLGTLHISAWQDEPLPAGTSTAVRRMPQLHSLKLVSMGGSMSAELVAAVADATQLRELWLEARSFEQPRALCQLTRPRQQRALHLSVCGRDAWFDVPEPAQLPALVAFAFVSGGYPRQDAVRVQVRQAGWVWVGWVAPHTQPWHLGSNHPVTCQVWHMKVPS